MVQPECRDFINKKMTEEKSNCCNSPVRYTKGSYMGQFHSICCNCDKYCKVNLVNVPIKHNQKK